MIGGKKPYIATGLWSSKSNQQNKQNIEMGSTKQTKYWNDAFAA